MIITAEKFPFGTKGWMPKADGVGKSYDIKRAVYYNTGNRKAIKLIK